MKQTAVDQEISQPFRPRARVLRLLGDELIGSPRLALFELVKNSYDADASVVSIRLDLREERAPTITVSDDGEGMTLPTLQNVWLVPGDDHRERQRKAKKRSAKFLRLPLGEKGLGRFAVHKLGNRIEVVTRSKGQAECVVNIDWRELTEKSFLDQAPVRIQTRKPEIFTGASTGTRLTIRQLRNVWTRGEVRRLHRQITSVSSPFESKGGFAARLEVPGHDEWISELPDVSTILNRAIWKFTFKLDGGWTWKYDFRKVPRLKLAPRHTANKKGEKLKLPPVDRIHDEKVVADGATLKGIGPVSGEFYVYDRDREVIKRLANPTAITDYLDENGGIRVYRDGMRVYNYGEPGDDWLGLDLRRVNAPTRGISSNIILGEVHLSLEDSTDLVEKTNREGFVENDACVRLRQIVLGALTQLESERQEDKDRIRDVTKKADDPEAAKIQKPIDDLRRALAKRGLGEKFEPYLRKIQHDYYDMQETLLSAGMSGLNLAVVFHEVERGVRALHQVIVSGQESDEAAKQARDLMHLLDGFSTLLRRDSQSTHSARKLIEAGRRFNVLRLRHHNIDLVAPILDNDAPGFSAHFAFNLVLGALNNLIDNSLYWLRVRWPDRTPEGRKSPRRLYIAPSDEFEGGPAIVVADTGPGLQDDPARIVRPFVTRKPSGMGLGLYYASLAMELNGGELVFPADGEVELPKGFDGAVAALVFKKAAK